VRRPFSLTPAGHLIGYDFVELAQMKKPVKVAIFAALAAGLLSVGIGPASAIDRDPCNPEGPCLPPPSPQVLQIYTYHSTIPMVPANVIGQKWAGCGEGWQTWGTTVGLFELTTQPCG
jgi:hypothetical protein